MFCGQRFVAHGPDTSVMRNHHMAHIWLPYGYVESPCRIITCHSFCHVTIYHLACYHISICFVAIYHFASRCSDCRITIYIFALILYIVSLYSIFLDLSRFCVDGLRGLILSGVLTGIGRDAGLRGGLTGDGVVMGWRGSALALCLVRSLFL